MPNASGRNQRMAKDEKTELDSLRIFQHVLFRILVLLALFAFVVLITHWEVNFKFTLLLSAVIIGSLTLAAILVREMIEHVKLRKEMNHAQSLYAKVLAISSDAIYIFDRGGKIEYVNAGCNLLKGN
jgi:PAS domain-containing protein